MSLSKDFRGETLTVDVMVNDQVRSKAVTCHNPLWCLVLMTRHASTCCADQHKQQ